MGGGGGGGGHDRHCLVMLFSAFIYLLKVFGKFDENIN